MLHDLKRKLVRCAKRVVGVTTLDGQVSELAELIKAQARTISELNAQLSVVDRKTSALDILQSQMAAANAQRQLEWHAEAGYLLDRAGRVGTVVETTTQPQSLDEGLARLKKLFPKAFPIWIELFENGRLEYEARPVGSLSVPRNLGAEQFKQFLSPYLYGHVLDIGCGPQPCPIYLEGGHAVRLAGIDPLPGSSQRTLKFVQGFAEFLPWGDQEFNTVVSATSLDHVLSLDLAFDEMFRVLRNDGRLVLWMGMVPGSPPYDPLSDDVKAIDPYHMFHFDRPWFEKLMNVRFVKLIELPVSSVSTFYVYKKRFDP